MYKSEQPALHRIDYAIKKATKCKKILYEKVLHGWTNEQRIEYLNRHNYCYICEKRIQDYEPKVLDHDHLTSKMRGVCHNQCNLQYRVEPHRWKLPILAHNLGKYDAKFLLQEIQERHGPVRVLPISMEKFLCFSVGDVLFLDSYLFLSSLLDSLVKDVLTNPKDWKYIYEATRSDDRLNDIVKKHLSIYIF